MEPIVYIYQDHLQDFWNSGQSQCFGAAFEWKGEQVYHVYIKYPQVAPTGYSMPCLFRVVDTDDYEKSEDVALSVYASMPGRGKTSSGRYCLHSCRRHESQLSRFYCR